MPVSRQYEMSNEFFSSKDKMRKMSGNQMMGYKIIWVFVLSSFFTLLAKNRINGVTHYTNITTLKNSINSPRY